MKKTILTAVICAAVLTGCSSSDSSSVADSSNEETTAQTTTTQQEQSQTETTTTAETTTTTAAESEPEETTTTTTAEESSSEGEQPAQQEKILTITNNKISCKSPELNIEYPDGWVITDEQEGHDESALVSDLAKVINSDLAVSSNIQSMKFKGQETVDDYISTLEETYKKVADDASDDPMAPKNIETTKGDCGSGKSLFTSYTQRNVKSYVYTFVFRNEQVHNEFLVFSYTYSDSDNADNIKTAIEQMMQ